MLQTDRLIWPVFDVDLVDLAGWKKRWPGRFGHAPGLEEREQRGKKGGEISFAKMERERAKKQFKPHSRVPNVTMDCTAICGISDQLGERDSCLSDLERKESEDATVKQRARFR